MANYIMEKVLDFNEFIELLKGGCGPDGDAFFPIEPYELSEKDSRFIDATGEDFSTGWALDEECEEENEITLHITDDDGKTVIPLCAYVVLPGREMDKMVLTNVNVYQGEDYDDDLDEIYATYSFRDSLSSVKKDIEVAYNSLKKEYTEKIIQEALENKQEDN